MGVYDGVFPMGLGTNRFPLVMNAPEEEIDKAANMVVEAFRMGVNYIDTANKYSQNNASKVLKKALMRYGVDCRITTKVTSLLKTADAAVAYVKEHLNTLGVDRVSDLMIWSVFSYEEFEEIMKPNGVYEGALRLKEEGVVEYITCSAHASPQDLIKIIETNVFPGMMISMSVLNYVSMASVLDCAYRHGVDIAVMNPLGGGMIPQGKEQFKFLLNEKETSVVQAALRFVKSHPAVKLVVAGPSNIEELREDVGAFTEPDYETAEDRNRRVILGLSELGKFCTGCKYCEPCPKGIPISSLMQSRNRLFFDAPEAYRCGDNETRKNIQVFKELNFGYKFLAEDADNPCVRCGACERKCTQGLKIMEGVSDMYQRMKNTGNAHGLRKERLAELLNGKGYKKVAIWPAGAMYATTVVQSYERYFGMPTFEFVYFNSSEALKGQVIDGRKIHSPEELLEIKPDCVLIVSYTYGEEIYHDLLKYEEYGIDILRLHKEGDVPWVY